jgi:cell division protein FtsI/penicillin-binding protein 2
MVFCLVAIGRLYFLQVEEGEKIKAGALGKQNAIIDDVGKRGNIYFSNGTSLLAITYSKPFFFISPDEMEDETKEEVSEKLSEILEIDKDEILVKANIEGSKYQIIAKEVTTEQVDKINELDYAGIYIREEYSRYYPGKSMASQISGFLNTEEVGQYGIEGYYNDILSGEVETITKSRSPWGFLFSLNEVNNDGADVYLTIDYNIQFKAEKLLDQALETYGATAGDIIVMDPNTGKILAMAQSPRFDLNDFTEVEDYSIYQNTATQVLFEPGSIFKPITMAAGLNEKAITVDTMFNDESGCKYYKENTVCNYKQKAYGESTMTEILENSMNTGVIFIEEQLGHETFLDYIEKFGFIDDLEMEFPSQYSSNSGFIDAYNYGIDVTFGNASFGQGVSMTPMHMIKAFATLVNGGNLMKPYIVEKITKGDEEEVIEPEILEENLISKEVSNEVVKMLVSVVENGYGKLAQLDGYYVGGKTGTSQIPYSYMGENKAGYSTDETWQSFMGFAPAYDPEFLILVKLDHATATLTSEYSAVPVFHDLAEYILNYYKIPFDFDEEEVTEE